jgi:hypothetical protein
MWQKFFKRENEHWRWGGIVAFSVYIHIHINTFQPFKSDDITYIWASTTKYWCHMATNTANVFLSSVFLLIVLPRYFKNFFAPEHFNFKKLVLIFISGTLIIGTGFFWGNAYFFKFEPTYSRYVSFLFNVFWINLLLTSFPVCITYLFLFAYFTREKESKIEENHTLNVSEVVNADIETPQYKMPTEPQTLIFTDGSSKKRLHITLDKLYYITSSQNYIEVFYQNGTAEMKRILLRNSLKAIEAEMIETAKLPLMRCHKAFIVNLEKVIDLRGTTHGAQFILENIETPIPISRQKYGEVKPLFSHFSIIS